MDAGGRISTLSTKEDRRAPLYDDRIPYFVAAIIILLFILGVSAELAAQAELSGGALLEIRESFVRLFRLNAEANVPTWYSSVQLLAGAGVCFGLARAEEPGSRNRRHWQLFSAVFVYLSIDEAAEIHEMLSRPTSSVVGASGPLLYAWIVPAAMIVVAFVLFNLRFVRGLPRRTAQQLALGLALYVGGAIGLEAVGSNLESQGDAGTVIWGLVASTEELLELCGVAICTLALYRLWARR